MGLWILERATPSSVNIRSQQTSPPFTQMFPRTGRLDREAFEKDACCKIKKLGGAQHNGECERILKVEKVRDIEGSYTIAKDTQALTEIERMGINTSLMLRTT